MTTNMTVSYERAALVAQRVEIQSVNLVRSSHLSRLSEPGATQQGDLILKHRARHEAKQVAGTTHGLLTVEVDYSLSLLPEEAADDGEPLLQVEATFRLTYLVLNVAGLPEETYTDFAILNGTFNSWPYWREFAQSQALRSGLANLTIPVFRPLPAAEAAKRREVAGNLGPPDELETSALAGEPG